MVFIKRKFLACIPCLDAFLKKIIKIRKASCSKEKYSNFEYYTRPIHLQDDYYIDDFDCIELISNNIINRILFNNRSNCCQQCEKRGNNEDVKLMELDCKCAYCQDCLEKVILKITNNYGYLLPCEVKMFNNKFKCKCGKLYTYYDFEKLYNKDETQINNAKKRFQRYKENYCMFCLKDLIKEDDVKKIKIKKEKDDNNNDSEDLDNLEHFMCIPCYKKYFNKKVDLDSSDEEDNTKIENNDDREKKKDEIKVNKEENKVKCEICEVWHHYTGDIDGCGCHIF